MLTHFAFDVYKEGAQPPDYQGKSRSDNRRSKLGLCPNKATSRGATVEEKSICFLLSLMFLYVARYAAQTNACTVVVYMIRTPHSGSEIVHSSL